MSLLSIAHVGERARRESGLVPSPWLGALDRTYPPARPPACAFGRGRRVGCRPLKCPPGGRPWTSIGRLPVMCDARVPDDADCDIHPSRPNSRLLLPADLIGPYDAAVACCLRASNAIGERGESLAFLGGVVESRMGSSFLGPGWRLLGVGRRRGRWRQARCLHLASSSKPKQAQNAPAGPFRLNCAAKGLPIPRSIDWVAWSQGKKEKGQRPKARSSKGKAAERIA